MVSDILLSILAPILLMIGLGAALQVKFRMDLNTLSKLNIYLFTPAFIFQNVYRSRLPWSDMAAVAGITILQCLLLGLLVYGAGKAMGVSRQTLAAVAMAVMFYNSGNYGLPLAQLAYPQRSGEVVELSSGGVVNSSTGGVSEYGTVGVKERAITPTLRHPDTPNPPINATTPQHHHSTTSVRDGAAVQAFVVMTMNVLTFTVGLAIAAYAGSGEWRQAVWKISQMPTLYGLVLAIFVRLWLQGDASRAFPIIFAKPIEYLSDGLVPMALITLGAQLGSNPRWPSWKPIGTVLVVRLLIAPAMMAAILYGLHFAGYKPLDLWPWPAELLILTAAVPTAVNTLLLTMELKGDAVLAADCVFWTTIFSCGTITGWLVVLRLLAG